MSIVAQSPTGLSPVPTYRATSSFELFPLPPVPVPLGNFSAFGFKKISLWWKKRNGSAVLPADSLTFIVTTDGSALVPKTPEFNLREGVPQEIDVDGSDFLEPIITGINLTNAPAAGEFFDVFVAGVGPSKFQVRP